MLILEPVENRERSESYDPALKNSQILVIYCLETKNARLSISRCRALTVLVAKVRTLTKAHWSLTTLVTESTLSGESSRQVGGDLWGSLGISGSRIAKRDFIRTTPAARIPAISDRRAGADKEEGGTVESNSHLHGLGRYCGRFGDRCSQPHQPRLSVGIPGASSK